MDKHSKAILMDVLLWATDNGFLASMMTDEYGEVITVIDDKLYLAQGAVSIAMSMSCIYVLESPGGWHVLSNTPALLWDPRRENAGLLAAGDKVQFTPISLPEYQALRARAERGEWAPDPVAAGGAP